MKLKINELAIAFANGYNIQYFDDEREILHNDCKIVELRQEEMTIANGEYEYEVDFDDVKILARPLSDLTKENLVDFYQLTSVDLELIDVDEWIQELIHLITTKERFQLSQFQLLFQWHFDVFGLIEKGLAINLTSIK